jgi:CHASE2 domain-containing sensor protein
MMAGKVAHMWRSAGPPGNSATRGAAHYLVLVLGLAGLVLLLARRRWEGLPILVLLVGISLIGSLLLAGTRRNLPVMPLVIALAGVSVSFAFEWARDRAGRRRLAQPESVLAPH